MKPSSRECLKCRAPDAVGSLRKLAILSRFPEYVLAMCGCQSFGRAGMIKILGHLNHVSQRPKCYSHLFFTYWAVPLQKAFVSFLRAPLFHTSQVTSLEQLVGECDTFEHSWLFQMSLPLLRHTFNKQLTLPRQILLWDTSYLNRSASANVMFHVLFAVVFMLGFAGSQIVSPSGIPRSTRGEYCGSA